jgi:gliding motility-associated-like protein
VNVSYTFNKPGTFTVKMLAVNSIGCTDSTIKTLVVRGTPAASFTPDAISVCKTDTTVAYLNSTTFNDFGPLTYRWLVDGSLKGTNGNFTYQYFSAPNILLPRIFTTQLIATNSVGCSDTAVGILQMNPNAKAQFSLGNTNQCVPFILPVNNASQYASKYQWYLNGVLADTAANPAIVITQALTPYRLQLIADNGFGCRPDTFELGFTSRIKPIAAFGLSDTLGCTGVLNVATTNRSSNANSYVWDWGDATAQSSFTSPSHLYNTQGQYVISLVASDGVCKDTAYRNVYVSQKPVVDFSVNDSVTCDTARIHFTNLTSGATGYLWSFSDGTTSTAIEPDKNFPPSLSYYTVRLVAYNALGCRDSLIKPNLIFAKVPPAADFIINPSPVIAIPQYTFSFDNITTNNNQYTYQWTLGDGSFESSRDVVHKYADTGSYEVRLVVFDNNSGCPDTSIKIATIQGAPGYLYVPNAFYPNSLQQQFKTFKPLGKGLASYTFQVFDGWGKLLFQSSELDAAGSPVAGWDGTFKGMPMPQNAYAWRISAKFRNGRQWDGMSYGNNLDPKPGNTFGTVTLFR